MHNFKVGDVVERVVNADYSSGMPSGGQGIITEVSGGGGAVRIKGYGSWWHLAKTLRAAVDDPLPPAPESVSYYNSYITRPDNDQHLVLIKDNEDYPDEDLMYLGIVPRTGSTRANEEIGINLDADAALQLAHDLRRMAMEIKRKEKQNG